MIKRTLFAIAAVVVFMIGRFLFFNSHITHEDIVSVTSIGNSLSSNEILPDSVLALEKGGHLQKDTRYLAGQRNDEEKTFLKNEDSEGAIVEKLKNKRLTAYHHSRQKPARTFYQVLSVAHFYDRPTEPSRRKDVIKYWNVSNESIKPVREKNDFIFVVYKQPLGPVRKGWLRKKDLKKVNTSYENNKE